MIRDYKGVIATLMGPDSIRYFVSALVFLLPVVAATTSSGSSIIYMVLVLLGVVLGRKWSALETWERHLLAGFVALFAVAALSLINTSDLHEGGKQLGRFLRIALTIPIYLLFRQYGLILGKALGIGAIVGTAVMAAQGWYEVEILGRYFAIGAYHKIIFGDLAILWGAVALVYALICLERWWKVLGVLAAGLAMYASLLSLTRGSWLFVPILAFLLLWLYLPKLLLSRRSLIAVFVLMLGLGSLVWQSDVFQRGVAQGTSDLESFMKDPSNATSWGLRINMWRNSLLLLREQPLLGSGLGDFQHDMQRMVDDGISWSSGVSEYSHAHSIYIDALAKMGLLGFAAMVVAMLILPFFAFARQVRPTTDTPVHYYAVCGMVVIAAFATFGLTEGLWNRNVFVNSYVICLVVLLSGLANYQHKQTDIKSVTP